MSTLRNRKVLVMAVVTALVCLSLSVVASAEPIKVRVWGLNDAVPGGVRNQIKVFNETHDDIKIVPEVPTVNNQASSGGAVTGGDLSNMQKLLTAIAGGNPPDLTTVDRFALPSWAVRNALMPLNDFIAADNYDMNKFYQFTVNEVTVDGNMYALPSGTDGRYLFWNKDMYKNAGLDPNAPPQTWEELQAYSDKLTIKRGRTFQQMGFISQLAPGGSFYLYTLLNGGTFMSEDARSMTLTDPKTVEALEWMVEWYDHLGGAETVNAFLGAFQSGSANDPFMAGKLAQLVMGDWHIGNIARYNPKMDFGMAPVPAATPEYYGRTWFGGWGWAIPRGAKNAEAAWVVAKWLTSEEGIRANMEGERAYRESAKLPFVPGLQVIKGLNEQLTDEIRDNLEPKFIEALEFRNANISDDSKVRHISPIASEIYSGTGRAVDAALYHRQTPREALEAAQEEMQQLLDEFYGK